MRIQDATPITQTADERRTLEGWRRPTKAEPRLVERAGIVLLATLGTRAERSPRSSVAPAAS
jgi:hypothetical protein